MQPIDAMPESYKPAIRCKICGNSLYSTDWGNYQVTYHCSSAEARFWDFDRGTSAQARSKDHWDASREELFFRKPLSAVG
jgi:hypothetical protein